MGAYRNSPTAIISGTDKVINFKFVRAFIGSIGTKAHLNFETSSRGRTQGLLKIIRAPI